MLVLIYKNNLDHLLKTIIMDKFVKECFVKNVHHFDALKIWQFIQIGHEVSLEIDEENKKEIRICISFKKTESLVSR